MQWRRTATPPWPYRGVISTRGGVWIRIRLCTKARSAPQAAQATPLKNAVEAGSPVPTATCPSSLRTDSTIRSRSRTTRAVERACCHEGRGWSPAEPEKRDGRPMRKGPTSHWTATLGSPTGAGQRTSSSRRMGLNRRVIQAIRASSDYRPARLTPQPPRSLVNHPFPALLCDRGDAVTLGRGRGGAPVGAPVVVRGLPLPSGALPLLFGQVGPGQFVQALEAKQIQEASRGAVEDGPPRRLLPARLLHQPMLLQPAEHTFRLNPPHRLDLRPGDGLAVRHDGQALEGGPAQPELPVGPVQLVNPEGQVRPGLQPVAAGHLHQADPPPGIAGQPVPVGLQEAPDHRRGRAHQLRET